ncbi:hypothetical protein Q4E93_29540 [Flavitalea sp. BT771]|uniref:hypothetical protein n=1 Tax=Flavitalea sp. BT771 TaxID=3063329 RepID=UPI0026E40237|nr:hypothetical protein [Flavitalea sp. BT771]MDO6434792.1 hypothetical protein [Flavitalea sp. BT771]MDV6223692.1 hypothetical protein [Flavitalea sp. BT771]
MMLLDNRKTQAFCVLTNKSSKNVIDHFAAIKQGSSRFGMANIIYHSTDGMLPDELAPDDTFVFTDKHIDKLGYRRIFRGLIPGSNHFPLLAFYLCYPYYDFYWNIEDDVRFDGDWSLLFNYFTSLDMAPDFVTSHIRSLQEEPGWYWWSSLRHPDAFIPYTIRYRSFNPIFRISNQALRYLHAKLTYQWTGHHEVLIPTLLHLAGFSIMDFGGYGTFVKPGNENMFYISGNQRREGDLSTGTMRYRPRISAGEYVKNKLHHPVK